MKKMMLLGVLLLSAAAGYGQESRQDVSFSGTGFFGPQVNGAGGVQLNSTGSLGLLTSYRYMLTPHSALELNYSFTQNQQRYQDSQNVQDGYPSYAQGQRIHSREQELSGAYVYSLNFKRFSPFAEVGIGAMVFSPIRDFGTQAHDTKQNTHIGGLFGAGLAYELSPSFDIRVEYRGFLVKAPDYGVPGDVFKTNRYEVFSIPAFGVAYHF